jgi:hypothetical protein
MAIDQAGHYAELEKELIGLLQKIAHWLPPEKLAEAAEYLAAREYGLALEEIIAGLAERPEGIHPSLAAQATKLARTMKIDIRPFMKALAHAG